MKTDGLILYRGLLSDIKTRVRQAQHRAALSANAEMILMYGTILPRAVAKIANEGARPTEWHEYALRNVRKPIGVANYELTRALPTTLASSLPSIESLEAELAGDRSLRRKTSLWPLRPPVQNPAPAVLMDNPGNLKFRIHHEEHEDKSKSFV